MEAITLAESKLFIELESRIERNEGAMLETAQALREIKSKRLYRAEYGTFEAYCNKRWEFTRRHGYRLIAFAEEVAMCPVGHTAPKNEREARATIAARKPICDTPSKTPAPVVDVDPADLPHDHDDQEQPHITQPTIDDKWRAATGNVKLEPELPAHIVALIDELKLCRDNCDAFVDCIKAQDCEPDSIKDAAKHLKKLAALMLAYAAEISE